MELKSPSTDMDLANVEQFPYLVDQMHSLKKTSIYKSRLPTSRTACYSKVSSAIFGNPRLTQPTKVMVYRTDVISTLMYARETEIFCRTWKIASHETSSNPVQHVAGPDHNQRSSPPRKGEVPRNDEVSPPTSMGQTPYPNARHSPTQTNPLP